MSLKITKTLILKCWKFMCSNNCTALSGKLDNEQGTFSISFFCKIYDYIHFNINNHVFLLLHSCLYLRSSAHQVIKSVYILMKRLTCSGRKSILKERIAVHYTSHHIQY